MKPDKSKMQPNNPVAIIGMGCLFPRSASLKEYWRLIFNGIDGITDIPDTHWSPDDYFDDDPKKPDHTYCKRGGFLPKIPFDPMEFGIPPSALEATDTSQLLGLVVAKMALENSGYGDGTDFNRDKTSVILGVTGTQEIVIPLGARLGFPKWRAALKDSGISGTKAEEIINRISESYISWQENSFPGLLGNVVAGRICNRLDLGGTNCVVDAACASSMGAVNLAVMELLSGRSDMAVTGGVDTLNDIFMHMCFSKTMTLSSTGDAKPFSKHADGTVLGEGIGMLMLKRLEDAERDNNRIYALIKSIGSSSDGRSQSIYAPRPEGQVKALTRAYEIAGIKPDSIELIEAHGTGTRVGDAVEFKSLSSMFPASSGNGYKCALGSVKSMIGHTKAASGAAGIIKAAMAIYSKVLPPTLKADEPDPELDFDSTPFYLNKCKRPWLPNKNHPRRSGVSAFGFGGSNFHLVLEEYKKEKDLVTWDGSVDILALSAASIENLIDLLDDFKNSFDKESTTADIMIKTAKSRDNFSGKSDHRLLIVLERPVDSDDYLPMIFNRIETAKAHLQSWINHDSWNFKNIFYGSGKNKGGTGFLFPGQGSQYPGMGIDIVCTFPCAIDALDSADKAFDKKERISDFIYPFNSTVDYKEKKYSKILAKTDIAQPAIGAVSLAMLRSLQYFGLKPDAAVGHSFGELTALMAAGRIDIKTFFSLAAARGALMAKAGKNKGRDSGAMLAVQAPLEELEELIKDNPDLVLANKNSINQGVLSGTTAAIDDINKIFKKKGYRAVKLDVSNAFHSVLVADAVEPFLKIVNDINMKSGDIPVYSNTTGLPYPADFQKAKKILGRHPGLPIDFISNIRNMYNDGIRTFIEIGPKAVLTGLVKSILEGRDINAIALDISSGKKSGIADLACALCKLASSGIELELTKWEHASIPKKKHLMNIPLTGANYIEHKDQIKNKVQNKTNSPKNNKRNTVSNKKQQTNKIDTTLNKTRVTMPPADAGSKGGSIVKKNITNNSNDNRVKIGAIPEALLVVQEGLKAMQALQLKTAETHEKFLETQAEASRTLQKMMESTNHLAEVSTGAESYYLNPVNFVEKKENQKTYQENKPASITPAVVSQQDENLDDQKAAKPLKDLEIEKHLLGVVAELTGYPSEMLGMDMDIESDLGIDSIKRVEIFSTLEEKLPDLPAVSPDDMAGLKTLGQIVDYLAKGAQHDDPSDNLPPDNLPKNNSDNIPDKKDSATLISKSWNSSGLDATINNNVEKRVVSIVEQSLVKKINISIPDGRKIYITNSGTGLAESIADEFAHHGIETAIIPKK
ncbi:MAG: acyltransferase domain-containing protein, partial [Deltaproteobacteria bacterium]|nr:acyltransferase domain-containing protein [Deltaproteobacteria bacterium]